MGTDYPKILFMSMDCVLSRSVRQSDYFMYVYIHKLFAEGVIVDDVNVELHPLLHRVEVLNDKIFRSTKYCKVKWSHTNHVTFICNMMSLLGPHGRTLWRDK